MGRSQRTKNLKLKTNNSGLTSDAGYQFSTVTRSAQETRRWGKELGRLLSGGEIIGLSGELGSGKTCFVRGLAEGLGVDKEAWVRSPSFTLINEYTGRLLVYHIDLFRLRDYREMEELNLREYLFSEGVSVIEWFESLPEGEAEEYLHIRFAYANGVKRELTFTAHGGRYEKIIEALKDERFKVKRIKSRRFALNPKSKI